MGVKSHPCHYCGGVADTSDHIVPKALGGPNERKNRVASCQPCNFIKGSDMPTCECPRCRAAVRLFGPGRTRNRMVVRALQRADARAQAAEDRARARANDGARNFLDSLVEQHAGRLGAP